MNHSYHRTPSAATPTSVHDGGERERCPLRVLLPAGPQRRTYPCNGRLEARPAGQYTCTRCRRIWGAAEVAWLRGRRPAAGRGAA